MTASLLFTACKKENDLTKSGEMLFLKHKGASMPVLVRGNFDSDVIVIIVHGGAGGSSSGHIEDFKILLNPSIWLLIETNAMLVPHRVILIKMI
jgi:hypothetical protein